MAQPRFFAANLPEPGALVTLDQDAAAHARVLRLPDGAAVTLFDGSGREHLGVLHRAGEAVQVMLGAAVAHSAATFPMTLVQCMPKGNKLDGIVRMATELGVSQIRLAVSERSTPTIHAGKLERLRRIAREASRQCGRASMPEMFPPTPLEAIPGIAPGILFWESADVTPLSGARQALSDGGSVVVGPEGGLTHREVMMLVDSGMLAIRLPGPVLRVETAAVAALALAIHSS